MRERGDGAVMSEELKLPKFLEGEVLPPGYYGTPDPYQDPPEWHVNLPELMRYAERKGVSVKELTKEEYKMFAT